MAVLAIGAWGVRQYTAKPAPQATVVAVRTAKVAPGNLERIVRAAGQTSARDFANVTAPLIRGPEGNRDMILTKLVKSGAYVHKGELLAQIDAQGVQDHVDDLRDTIQAAEADVHKTEAEQAIAWENLQQTLRIAKSEYDKAKLDASAAEVRTDIERQLLQLSLDEAHARYKQQESDLKFTKISQDAQLKILKLTRDRHTRHRNRHLIDLQRFTIKAPMDGLAVMSPIFRGGEMGQIQEGDRVFPGQSFMKVVNTKSMQVEGSINQTETSDFRIGQPARIHLDAFPGMEFKGKIYSIGALAVSGWRQNYYIRTLPVRVEIEGSDPKLIPDLSASADVILDHAEGKLLVPLSAVSTEAGKNFAYVKDGENFDRREVHLGLQDETRAVVLAGLQTGDEVRLN